jgi:hypothetical protein
MVDSLFKMSVQVSPEEAVSAMKGLYVIKRRSYKTGGS